MVGVGGQGSKVKGSRVAVNYTSKQNVFGVRDLPSGKRERSPILEATGRRKVTPFNVTSRAQLDPVT